MKHKKPLDVQSIMRFCEVPGPSKDDMFYDFPIYLKIGVRVVGDDGNPVVEHFSVLAGFAGDGDAARFTVKPIGKEEAQRVESLIAWHHMQQESKMATEG